MRADTGRESTGERSRRPLTMVHVPFLWDPLSSSPTQMHISIPDSEEIEETKPGSASVTRYVQYNIHINGTFHCSARYPQMPPLRGHPLITAMPLLPRSSAHK